MSKHEDAIRAGAAGLLDGEEILAAMVASPRGSTTAAMGGAAGLIGQGKAGKQGQGAADAGLVVQRNSGLVLTPTRLVTLALGISFTGGVKEVKEVLSSLPLSDVDSLEAKRMGAAGVITISANGNEFKLEGKAPGAQDLAAAFARAKAG